MASGTRGLHGGWLARLSDPKTWVVPPKGQFAKDLPGLRKATLTCRLLDVGRPLLSGDGLKGAVGEAGGDRQELLVNLEKSAIRLRQLVLGAPLVLVIAFYIMII